MKFVHMLFGLLMALSSAVTFAQAVDINTASAEQLEKAIKGIGPARATAIVNYRTTNGPFKSVDDLLKVQWIKDKALSKILQDNKDQLTVGTTAAVPAAAVPATPAMPAVPATPAVVPATPAMPTAPAIPAAVPATPAMPTVPATPAAPVAPAK